MSAADTPREEASGGGTPRTPEQFIRPAETVFRPSFKVPFNKTYVVLDFSVDSRTPEAQLLNDLLNSDDRSACFAISGPGGVGKTCTLLGLSREPQVRKRFRDGIYYIQLGRDYQLALGDIVRRTGGQRFLALALSAHVGTEAAASMWFAGKCCLFLLADVWQDRFGFPDASLVRLFDVSAGSRMVLTTRDMSIATLFRQYKLSASQTGHRRVEAWVSLSAQLSPAQLSPWIHVPGSKVLSVALEAKLRAGKVKQSQCFLLLLGGGGRGKTSTLRSLRGMRFIQEHLPTELASLSRIQVVPGGRHLTGQEVEELVAKTESFEASVSRGTEYPVEETAATVTLSPAVNDGTLLEEAHRSTENSEVATESGTVVSTVDQNLGPIPFSENPHIGSVLDKAFSAFKTPASQDDLFPLKANRALVQCWDLAGQHPYMMAHALFLGFGSIFVFVVNLLNLANHTTRQEEIRELCRWMHLVYFLCKEPVNVRTIIVGTQRAECDIGTVEEVLRNGLKHELNDAVYDTWVKDDSISERKVGWRLPFVAIENSIAITEPAGSGLNELEKVVNRAANSVINTRLNVPVRWVALIEELEKIECIFLTKIDVSDIVDGFPGFDVHEHARGEDVLNALRYYRGLGRLVLFETSADDYVLFPDPSVILDFIRRVTGPEQLVRRRLCRRDAVTLDNGILTRDGLAVLWAGYPENALPMMLDLLCKFDILMRLKTEPNNEGELEELIAIPALLPNGFKEFPKRLKPGELEVTVATCFNEALPPGVAGSLIANLYRTMEVEQAKVGFLGSTAAILSVRLDTCGGRIAVHFMGERRRLVWTVRSNGPLRVTHSCLRTLEDFLNGPLHEIRIPRKHVVIGACQSEPYGCGGSATVEFAISPSWVENVGHPEFVKSAAAAYCKSCGERWEASEVLPGFLRQESQGLEVQPVRAVEAVKEFDVFISHAGSDKESAAYPLYEFLEAGGLRCFLDEEGIEVSRRTTDAQLYAAIRGSKAAVFILSADFIGRKWPMRELRGFLNLVDRAEAEEREGPLLLPLFYKLRVEECKNGLLPHVEGYEARFRANGFFEEDRQNECSTEQAMEGVGRLTRFPGLRNDVGESEKEFAWRVACRLFKFFRNEGSAGG